MQQFKVLMDTARYTKQIRLKGFGKEAQEKLSQAKVLIIGAGGLGNPVAQYLAAMGTGTIGLVDADQIEASNLPRQTLFGPDDLGKPKTEVLKYRLLKQNPDIQIYTYQTFLSPDNALTLLSGYDLAVDASDNIATRYLLNDACIILHKPFVYGAVHAFEGQVSVFNYQQGPTYRCLFPETDSPLLTPDCDDTGVLGALPALVGTYQALEVVKVLTGIGKPLSGALLVLDALSQSHYKMGFQSLPGNHDIQELKSAYAVPECISQVQMLTAKQLQEWMDTGKPMELIDVRMPEEFEISSLESARNLPLQELGSRLAEIDYKLPVVLVCQSGKRSGMAAALLLKHHPTALIYHLEGGLNAF
jgi:molybdopterin/thiamine biosynthesis adenylyltransferase/rhodanese-related sulfurtransferase